MPASKMPKGVWAFLVWGLLVGTFIVGFVVVSAWINHTMARELLALPTEAEQPGGGMVFEGVLERDPSPRESPLGESLAGWTGRVISTVRSGKSSHSSTLCTGAELDKLVLRDPKGAWRLPLTLASSRPISSEPTQLSHHGSKIQLVLGPTVESDEVPPKMRSWCSLSAPRSNETWTYYETRLPSGGPAVFLGCRRGDGLEPCPLPSLAGGHLAAGGRSAIVRALLVDADQMTSLGTLIALFFSLVAAGYAYTHLRRYDRLGSGA